MEAGSMRVFIAVVAIDGDHELIMVAFKDDLKVLAVVEWHGTIDFFIAPASMELGVPDHTVHVDSRVEVEGCGAVMGLEVDCKILSMHLTTDKGELSWRHSVWDISMIWHLWMWHLEEVLVIWIMKHIVYNTRIQ